MSHYRKRRASVTRLFRAYRKRKRRECCEKRRASVVSLIKYIFVRKKWQSRCPIGWYVHLLQTTWVVCLICPRWFDASLRNNNWHSLWHSSGPSVNWITEKWQLRITRVKCYLFVARMAILNWYSTFSIIMLTGCSAEECGNGGASVGERIHILHLRDWFILLAIILMSLWTRWFSDNEINNYYKIADKRRVFVYISHKK